jgi:2,3-bisphosphoglycerate-independent phosphoglycerate mutase
MTTKYIILLGDGMADRPHAGLGGKTCLQAARTPNPTDAMTVTKRITGMKSEFTINQP